MEASFSNTQERAYIKREAAPATSDEELESLVGEAIRTARRRARTSVMYCCIWCHTALERDETFVNHNLKTVSQGCRGLGIVLNKWNKKCGGAHVLTADDADAFHRLYNHAQLAGS